MAGENNLGNFLDCCTQALRLSRSGFQGWGGRGLRLLALGWDALGLMATALGHVGGAVCVPTVSLQGSYSVPTSSPQSNPALLLVWLKSRCTTQRALSSS